MRGPPSVAGHGRVKGQGNAAWIADGGDSRVRAIVSNGGIAKNRRGGAPEGAPAPRTGRRGAFAKVPRLPCAVPALRLPQGGRQEPGDSPGTSDGEIRRFAAALR